MGFIYCWRVVLMHRQLLYINQYSKINTYSMDLYKICNQKLNYFNYSDNTKKTYLNYIQEFSELINKHPSRITAQDVQYYLVNYDFSSVSKQNQVISSLKFMWHRCLGKKYLKIDFKRPRKEKKLPRLINVEDAVKKIQSISNLKHKAIITLGLSCGLRVSETLNLKPKDIDSSRMVIHIKSAKGRKDRIVPLSDNTLYLLREYYKKYRPINYLFDAKECLSK